MKLMECGTCGERQMRGGTGRKCHLTPKCVGRLMVVPSCHCCDKPAETVVIGTELVAPVCVDCALTEAS